MFSVPSPAMVLERSAGSVLFPRHLQSPLGTWCLSASKLCVKEMAELKRQNLGQCVVLVTVCWVTALRWRHDLMGALCLFTGDICGRHI